MIEPTNLQASGTMGQIDAHIVVLIVLGIFTLANTVIISLVKLGINKFSGEMASLWEAITVIRDKQELLRETLPKEYLRVAGPGYMAIMESLIRIERHFEEFAQDCREGKCGGKKAK